MLKEKFITTKKGKVLNKPGNGNVLVAEEWKVIADYFMHPVIIVDTDYKNSWCNKAAISFFDCPTEKIIGRDFADLMYGNRKSSIDCPVKKSIGSIKIESSELFLHSKDNWVKISAIPLASPGNEPVKIICVIEDITQLKQAEEALKESEEKYLALAENPLTGVFIIQKRKCVYYNRRFAEMHGYNTTELLNKSTLPLVHPDYREFAYLRVEQVISGERPPEIGEQKRVKKNGVSFWAESIIVRITYRGEPALAGTILDITDRKEAQERMKQAHDELTRAVNQMERKNYANDIMSEMRDLIQVASSMEETPPIIKSAMEKLFPGAGGALFIMSPSKSDLEAAIRWGDFPDDVDDNVFGPDACWALRRGRAHIVENMNSGPVCPHLKHPPLSAYTCIPMIAKGEVIGVLHLRDSSSMKEDDKQTLIASFQEMAILLSEYLSLSISNLRLRETLKYQSIKDPLTGLFNRRFMLESFNREIARASRKQTSIGIIMIDIDHFKKFNDDWGHAAGDELLIQIGRFFREMTREADIACRYGGEEFAILMPESDIENTFKRADKLRQDVKNLRAYIGGQLLPPVKVSMGISAYPTHGKNAEDLLHIADTALYRAKQEGRDRVVIA